ncbi:MAG TPA: SGNH/GDSL hydrolase family protein [Acidimicrobiales bacterium]|jgi:lysophospholipase L1-like esterase|nr:SGNH/GDSL hydrolase family protein [Acidimicrobiales bacterium]
MQLLRPRGTAAPTGTEPSGVHGRPSLHRVPIAAAALVAAGTAVFATAAVAGPAGTAPMAAQSHSYVALGDSFTSGPAVPAQLGPDTSPSAPSACLRSSDNYPSLAARALGLDLSDVSCGGATTEDLTRSQGPGIPAQLSALGPSTSLVSVGIGGNDLGFSTIAASCAAATPWGATQVGWSCRAHYTVGGVDQLATTVRGVGTKVATALEEIRARAPHARVFVIGYPDIVPPSGSGCWPVLPFSGHDLDYLRGIEGDLNATLARDAVAADDVYVDMATPSASHNACTSDDTRWVEPIVPSPGSYPLHPSTAGMSGMARVLEGAVTSTAWR